MYALVPGYFGMFTTSPVSRRYGVEYPRETKVFVVSCQSSWPLSDTAQSGSAMAFLKVCISGFVLDETVEVGKVPSGPKLFKFLLYCVVDRSWRDELDISGKYCGQFEVKSQVQ